MVERRSEEPLPPVHNVRYGSPPLADGQIVKAERPPLPLATREVVIGWLIFLIVVAAILIRTLR